MRAISAVAAGEVIFGVGVARRALSYLTAPRPSEPAFPELTPREREVLELIAEGKSNSVIAARLGLAANTVSNHISNVFAKLQVASRAEAIVRARTAGSGAAERLSGRIRPVAARCRSSPGSGLCVIGRPSGVVRHWTRGSRRSASRGCRTRCPSRGRRRRRRCVTTVCMPGWLTMSAVRRPHGGRWVAASRSPTGPSSGSEYASGERPEPVAAVLVGEQWARAEVRRHTARRRSRRRRPARPRSARRSAAAR